MEDLSFTAARHLRAKTRRRLRFVYGAKVAKGRRRRIFTDAGQ